MVLVQNVNDLHHIKPVVYFQENHMHACISTSHLLNQYLHIACFHHSARDNTDHLVAINMPTTTGISSSTDRVTEILSFESLKSVYA